MTFVVNFHIFSKHAPDEDVDAGEQEEVGEEWPDFEDPDVALHREFDQVTIIYHLVVGFITRELTGKCMRQC